MPRLLACSALLVVVSTLAATEASAADETYEWRKESGGIHGSQVASSEWLPIMIGAAGGVAIGGLTGIAFDDAQPAVIGPIVGGVLGGVSGGAAGSWIIRSFREQDTRLAGTVCGLGFGAGLGAIMFTKVEADGRTLETIGKFAALGVGPLVGAFVGRHLATYMMGRVPDDKTAAPPPPPVTLNPSFNPVMTRGVATGMTFGFDATF